MTEEKHKIYKGTGINNYSSFRTVMIFPGDLCGCRMIFPNNFLEGFN